MMLRRAQSILGIGCHQVVTTMGEGGFIWDILTVQAEFFNRDTFVAGVGVV